MPSSYRLTLENWLKELDVKADTVLDIGGSQNPVKDRVRSWDVVDYKIADLPNPHEGNKPDFELDLNKHRGLWADGHKVHLAFCLEVFEYIYDPANAMRVISNMLWNNGRVWVTFPSFYPLHNPVEDDCLRYMPSGIRKLAEHAGLEVVQMIPRRPETGALLQYFSAERLRAAKGQDHMFMGFIVELRKSN